MRLSPHIRDRIWAGCGDVSTHKAQDAQSIDERADGVGSHTMSAQLSTLAQQATTFDDGLPQDGIGGSADTAQFVE